MCHSSRLWESAAPVNSQQLPCPSPAVRRDKQELGRAALATARVPCQPPAPRVTKNI